MDRSSLPLEVVCDAGPVIHLDELGCLDLLSDCVVLVPEVVWQEVTRHRPAALENAGPRWNRLPALPLDEAGFVALVRALALDAGEQAALALARQRSGAILLTDDAAARLAAEQLGVPIHGTIGILLRAIRRGQRTPAQVLALLQSMPEQSSLHIRADLLAEIEAQVRREFNLH